MGLAEELDSLRRLFDDGRRFSGAAGAPDLLVDQRPMVWSAEAERMRELGAWTARESTEALWPNSSSDGVKEPCSPTAGS